MGMFWCKKDSRRDNNENCVDRNGDGIVTKREFKKAQRNGLFNNQNNCQPVADSCSYVITPTCTFSNSSCSTNSCGPSVSSQSTAVSSVKPTDVESSEATKSLVDRGILKLNDNGTISFTVNTDQTGAPIAVASKYRLQNGTEEQDPYLTKVSPVGNIVDSVLSRGFEKDQTVGHKVTTEVVFADGKQSRNVNVVLQPGVSKFRIDVGGKTFIIDRAELEKTQKGAGAEEPLHTLKRAEEKSVKPTEKAVEATASEKPKLEVAPTAPSSDVTVPGAESKTTEAKKPETKEKEAEGNAAKPKNQPEKTEAASTEAKKETPEAKAETPASTVPKADETKKEVNPALGAVVVAAGWLGIPLGRIFGRAKDNAPKTDGAEKTADPAKPSPDASVKSETVGTLAEATSALNNLEMHQDQGKSQNEKVSTHKDVDYFVSDKGEKVVSYDPKSKSLTVYERNASGEMVTGATVKDVKESKISDYLGSPPPEVLPLDTSASTEPSSKADVPVVDPMPTDNSADPAVSDPVEIPMETAPTKEAAPDPVVLPLEEVVKNIEVAGDVDTAWAVYDRAKNISDRDFSKPLLNDLDVSYYVAADNTVLAHNEKENKVSVYAKSGSSEKEVSYIYSTDTKDIQGFIKKFRAPEPATTPEVSLPVGDLSKVEELVANPIKNYKAYHKESDTLSARSEDDKVAYYEAENKTVLVHNKNTNEVSDYVARADGTYKHNVVHKTKDLEAALDYIKQSLESFMSTEVKAPEPAATPEASSPAPANPEPAAGTDGPIPTPPEINTGATNENVPPVTEGKAADVPNPTDAKVDTAIKTEELAGELTPFDTETEVTSEAKMTKIAEDVKLAKVFGSINLKTGILNNTDVFSSKENPFITYEGNAFFTPTTPTKPSNLVIERAQDGRYREITLQDNGLEVSIGAWNDQNDQEIANILNR